jgi:hypothetical protein
VARRTAARLVKVLKKHGREVDPELGEVDVSAADDTEHSALTACYAAAAAGTDLFGERAGSPALRLVDPSLARPDEPVAIAYRVNVHAAVRVHGRVQVATELGAIGRVLAKLELPGRTCARGFARTLGIGRTQARRHRRGRAARPIGPACDHSYPPSQGISQFVFLIRSISGRSGKRSRDPSETSARCPPPLAGRLPVG